MNKEQIKQIVHEVLRDPRLGSWVAAAAPAPSRTRWFSPFSGLWFTRTTAVPPPTARAAVLVKKGRLELREFPPARAIRENGILARGGGLRASREF